MLVECSYCRGRVDGTVIGEIEEGEFPYDFCGERYRTYLVRCPACERALVAIEEWMETGQGGYRLHKSKRVFPEPDDELLTLLLPKTVSASLEEARLCYRAGASRACAVMCGRALEAMCKAFVPECKALATGLAELRNRQIIDGRLYAWGESLREVRNIGAHANEEAISIDDARDVFDFATAICEYVYVLSHRYEKYLERKAKAKSGPTSPTA